MEDTKDEIGLGEIFMRGLAAAGNVNIWGWLDCPGMDGTMKKAPGTTVFDGMAHMGTKPCGTAATGCCACGCGGCRGRVVMGAREADTDTLSLTSTYSLLAGRLRFFLAFGSSGSALELVVVGILRVPLTDMAIAGTVPVPVAAIIAGSACSSNHLIVSPSDLWPNSLVS
jgi:hypothetical protein